MTYLQKVKNLLLEEVSESYVLCLKELKNDSDIEKLKKAIQDKTQEISMMDESLLSDFQIEGCQFSLTPQPILRNQKDGIVLDRYKIANEILLKNFGFPWFEY